MLNIMPNASTAFHLQTDGQTEQANQEIEKYLCIFISYWQTDWSDWPLLAEFAHNNQIHSATRKSPFMVLYGHHPRILPDSPRSSPFANPTAEIFVDDMTSVHKETQKALEEATTRMKTQYDKKKCTTHEYRVGDQAWLDAMNLHLP